MVNKTGPRIEGWTTKCSIGSIAQMEFSLQTLCIVHDR